MPTPRSYVTFVGAPLSTVLGVAITAATVLVLVIGYFLARRRRAFPAYGWLGWVALVSAEVLMFAHVEPVATYFTPIAWSAYILIADAAVLAVTNRSRLNDAPLVVARMALLSIPLWLIFEAYNLRLQNWTYVGVPLPWLAGYLGYGWSFATITPAIFETSDLVQALLPPLPGGKSACTRSEARKCRREMSRTTTHIRDAPQANAAARPHKSNFQPQIYTSKISHSGIESKAIRATTIGAILVQSRTIRHRQHLPPSQYM